MEVDSEQLFAILAMLYFIERKLGGGFQKKNVHPYLGKIPILINIFQMGWFNHQLENIYGQRLLETFPWCFCVSLRVFFHDIEVHPRQPGQSCSHLFFSKAG